MYTIFVVFPQFFLVDFGRGQLPPHELDFVIKMYSSFKERLRHKVDVE